MQSKLIPVVRPLGFHPGHEFLAGLLDIDAFGKHRLADQLFQFRLLLFGRHFENHSPVSELHILTPDCPIRQLEELFTELSNSGCHKLSIALTYV